MKKVFNLWILVLGISVILISCEKTPISIPVTGISLNDTEVEVFEGESIQITATITPDNATNKSIIWDCSNESVATVDNGVITGIKEGTAVMTASIGDVIDNCTIIVKNYNKETIVGIWKCYSLVYYNKNTNEVIGEPLIESYVKYPEYEYYSESGKIIPFTVVSEYTTLNESKSWFEYKDIVYYWSYSNVGSYYFEENELCRISHIFDNYTEYTLRYEVKIANDEFITDGPADYTLDSNGNFLVFGNIGMIITRKRVNDEGLLKELNKELSKLY